MSNILRYKGYSTHVNYDASDGLLYGKLEGLRSRILFDESEASSIEEAFHRAVDEYLADCVAEGVDPEQPYGGSFNVRIGSTLHRECAERAALDGTSMNEVVRVALVQYLRPDGSVEVVPEPVVSAR